MFSLIYHNKVRLPGVDPYRVSTPIGYIFASSNLAQSGFDSRHAFLRKAAPCSRPKRKKLPKEFLHFGPESESYFNHPLRPRVHEWGEGETVFNTELQVKITQHFYAIASNCTTPRLYNDLATAVMSARRVYPSKL